MSHRILFLPADPAAAATLVDLDPDGSVHARVQLPPDALAPPAPATWPAVLVVPGIAVRIDRLDLPAHSQAQARAAAEAMLVPRLARPAPLHVALDAAGDGDTRTVAAVDPDVMQSWLDRAAGFGLAIDAAVPEQLLLPAPAEDSVIHVLDAGDRWLVRGDGLAFVAEPPLAARVLGDRERLLLEGSVDGFAARAREPEVDLLQGPFTPAWKRARPAGRRRLAWLSAALLASPLIVVAAQGARLELAARGLEARAAAMVQEALPAAAPRAVEDPDQVGERLRAALEPRAFAAATGALFAAVAARPETHLVELEYRRGDRLRAVLAHAAPDDLEALRGVLAAEGWDLVEGGSREVSGRLRTAVSLEPRA